MEKRFLRSKGMASMKYGRESEYFTIVMHHGGFMVNSSAFKYTGKEVSFIGMCHVDNMSMLEMYDIVEELGYSGLWHLFWKQSRYKFTVKPLRTYCDIISMLEDMPRNRHIHLYLEENEANFSNETIETRYQNAIETHKTVITEMHETHETYETFMIELNSEEDTKYVADDIDSSVSDFEYSENDVSEEEGSTHEVHVRVDFERDFNGLNNIDEGNINASLNNENETDGVESLHTENESDSESDSDGRGKYRCPKFNDETDMENPQFKVGMIFGDKLKFKEAVRQYGIKNRVDVRFKRIDSVRVHVVCKEGCSWANPQYPITALRQDVLKDHVYKVSLSKCLRAKHLAIDMVLGSRKGQDSKIYDYLGELRSSNPGSTTILKLDNRVFERMHICLQACKEGFKGCRPIISIDGCHLKGYNGGTLLAAVGIDGNDNIYPIAYDVVEIENESSWTWTKIMENIAKKKEVANKYTGSLCPRIQKKIELAIQQSTRCWPTHAGGEKYQVSAGPSNQHVIDLENHSCSCRK
ncbi:hypothetical protein F3Y22_tig00013680pilonHSYRG00033 [Hibiscus syriacus]|uniref:Uncharacterized protein n=1 Tax=Hibiscus syriacus TaxID=106335 RepID=A0A6A3C193_HIBSY|nr:hypothetical protein F3Y22_tig00013680pilonHSYRG00033 [Hibiscus syriacus]